MTGCRILVTEKVFLDRALDVRASGTTALRTIVCLDGGDETTLSWQELIECRQEEFDLEAAAAAVRADDLLTVMHTFQAQTGRPSSSGSRTATCSLGSPRSEQRLAFGDGWRAISWQPMADIAERLCTHYLPLVYGWQVTTCADPGAVAALLPDIRPEFFWAPPRSVGGDAGVGARALRRRPGASRGRSRRRSRRDRARARAHRDRRRGPVPGPSSSASGGAGPFHIKSMHRPRRSGWCRDRGAEREMTILESGTDIGKALGTDYFLLRSELTSRRPTIWTALAGSSRTRCCR